MGRHDADGVNYAYVNAGKICQVDHTATGPSKRLFVLQGGGVRNKAMHGGLLRVTLNKDGTLPEKADWVTKAPRFGAFDAMVVAGERIYVTSSRLDDDEAMLAVYSTVTSELLYEETLPSRPVRDGLAAAYGCLYVSGIDGNLYCLGSKISSHGS